MSDLVRDTAIVRGSPDAVWSIIEDPAALARVLPGAESIVADGPGRFRGVLATRIQFLTVRADVVATFHDADPLRHLRLVIEGRPRGLAGSFAVSVPFDLAPLPAPADAGAADAPAAEATEIRYAVDLQVTGRLATFGAPLLRDTLRRQIAALVANVDRELAIRAPGRPGMTEA
ncbi:MAG TPA: SRPBCC domain-containing protein [Candidatus Limnocylindrales bacterium]|nr:SRPBCC domain-containing protein [Candidatus Limnocylindrales bacterium]